MNIYMTGASGTGKTSLAQGLCGRLALNEAPSVARTSPYKMRTQECQDYVMHCVDYQCRTATQSVVTRTPIDVYGYSFVWQLDFVPPLVVSHRFLRTHPILLYLPKYWEPEDDGFRPLEKQDSVDEAITWALQKFEADYFTIQNESVADRADHVIEWLSSRGLIN